LVSAAGALDDAEVHARWELLSQPILKCHERCACAPNSGRQDSRWAERVGLVSVCVVFAMDALAITASFTRTVTPVQGLPTGSPLDTAAGEIADVARASDGVMRRAIATICASSL
jgi:hypothetical protein